VHGAGALQTGEGSAKVKGFPSAIDKLFSLSIGYSIRTLENSFSFTLTISPFHGHSFSVPLTFEELSPSSSYFLWNPFLSFEEIRKFVMF